jgi:hypothetical protein
MRKQCFLNCLDYVIISIGSIWGVGSMVLSDAVSMKDRHAFYKMHTFMSNSLFVTTNEKALRSDLRVFA